MKNKPSHLRLALREQARNDTDLSDTLRSMAVQLRVSPTESSRRVAEALLGITDVPEELWRDPLPSTDNGQAALTAAIDRLSAEWDRTALHRLVALRRVAWAATQLARVIEKSLDERARNED